MLCCNVLCCRVLCCSEKWWGCGGDGTSLPHRGTVVCDKATESTSLLSVRQPNHFNHAVNIETTTGANSLQHYYTHKHIHTYTFHSISMKAL